MTNPLRAPLAQLAQTWRKSADPMAFGSYKRRVIYEEALRQCADELSALLAAVREGEETPPSTIPPRPEHLHQFPCGHYVSKIRRGDGSYMPIVEVEKCVPCRTIDELRSQLAQVREAASSPVLLSALRSDEPRGLLVLLRECVHCGHLSYRGGPCPSCSHPTPGVRQA